MSNLSLPAPLSTFCFSIRIDVVIETGKELGARHLVFATPEHARVSCRDKEGRFLTEKKVVLGEVVASVTRDLRMMQETDKLEPNHAKSSREEKGGSGPSVIFNFNFLDRDKYSQSKKKMEIRKSEKLAAALAR